MLIPLSDVQNNKYVNMDSLSTTEKISSLTQNISIPVHSNSNYMYVILTPSKQSHPGQHCPVCITLSCSLDKSSYLRCFILVSHTPLGGASSYDRYTPSVS